tara:strand:- start:220 stop:324 length:105 start_codon:yes stop_codon:yes gene_type:complete
MTGAGIGDLMSPIVIVHEGGYLSRSWYKNVTFSG